MNAFVINMDNRPDKLETFKKNIFPFEVERVSGVKASCGEDGCTQAHLNLLQKQTKFPFVIFEDDCVLVQPWEVVEKAMTQLPSNWDGLWVGATLTKSCERYSENLFRLRRAFATHAIIYNSPEMVQYILRNHNTPSGTNLDIFYSKKLQSFFQCFVTYPLVASQSPSISDITGEFVDHTDYILGSYKKYAQ